MDFTADQLRAARARIGVAYDPDVLEAALHQLAETLAAHFAEVESGRAPALNWADPAELVQAARAWLDRSTSNLPAEAVAGRVAELARQALSRGNNLHHPRYVGHQVPASVPLASLFDLVGSITNQVMAIYEMGPWATAVEQAVVGAVGEQLGFPAGRFAGLVTSGASLANLTALVTARNVALEDSWTSGLAGGSPPAIVVHSDIHYSVTRAAGILGVGTDQLVKVGLDAQRRMDPRQLDATLADLAERGTPVVAVVAAACATPIGAFDRLPEIADVCAKHQVWLHVDAAHGGAVCFSRRHRHLIAGIERADSVVCDAHKMMFMPALCALLFYRNPAHRVAAFHQNAPYLYDPAAPELAEYDSGLATVECTKRAAAFGVWGTWSLFGTRLFADMVDVTCATATRLYDMLQAAEDFEAPYQPQSNIVVFRYLPRAQRGAEEKDISAFQLRLRRALIESGECYLVQTSIDGRSYLRATVMNPLTTEADLREILASIRRHGATR